MAAEAFTGTSVSSSLATGTMGLPAYFFERSALNGFNLSLNPNTNKYTCVKSGVTVFSGYTASQVASLWHLLAENCAN